MDGTASNNDESQSQPSEERAEESSVADSAEQRWTCEACGCNTNSESDRSCTICGTRRDNGTCDHGFFLTIPVYQYQRSSVKSISAKIFLLHDGLVVEEHL